MSPDHTAVKLRRSGQGRARIGRSLWKGLNTRRLQFVVHADGWLHSMVLNGRRCARVKGVTPKFYMLNM